MANEGCASRIKNQDQRSCTLGHSQTDLKCDQVVPASSF